MPTTSLPRPPFDPHVAAALDAVGEALPSSLTPEMIPLLRRPNPLMPPPSDDELSQGGVLDVSTRTVPGPDGDLEVIVLRPTAAEAPLPAVLHTHGGGMILGDARSGLLEVAGWAAELGLVVVSVDYRLAPETPHPGPVEDCYAALVWTARHAAELGAEPARIVVAGASAGGGLAAALALMARDRGEVALAGQVLIYPMLDDRSETVSAQQMAGVGVWDRTSNQTGWGALLGDAVGGPDVSPYAAPARATDLSGLPPAFIDVASAETFRDEDVAYASRIWAAGGVAELHVWPGGCHGFDLFVPDAPISQAARASRVAWLRRLLAG
ncbi:alpha/beta hydrolase [Klenkia taihuensis]|uniref:Acetyl esterase/lipase n=1 Tax=Klenkia taihuensis TaxID=1225127 RepID=A0A1I1V5F1_9ACTN|nr:alpha/beta hydrolase [Klenkia taihuensis]GHE14520.1 esterase [Klenkia taihuensis]SFD78272.1 Acetyl esterase/lipase [Klenkia taihuensis]